MVSVKGLKHRNYSIKLCSKHRINWEVTWTLTLACLRYTTGKKDYFETQILTYSNIELTQTNKLAEFKELHWKLWQGLMTVCVSLCAIRKCPYIFMLRWFVKSVLPTLSFEPLFWYRHDVPLNDWSRFDQQRSEKIMWVQLNQIKPLGFDSPSNTSSWRLFFKSSVTTKTCFKTLNKGRG